MEGCIHIFHDNVCCQVILIMSVNITRKPQQKRLSKQARRWAVVISIYIMIDSPRGIRLHINLLILPTEIYCVQRDVAIYEISLKIILNSNIISIVPIMYCDWSIVLKYCTWHCNITVVHSFQHDLVTRQSVLDIEKSSRDLSLNGFRGISYIAITTPENIP